MSTLPEKVVTVYEMTPAADQKADDGLRHNHIAPVEAEIGRSRLTSSQDNAVRSAEQYLHITGFPRRGLIQQLSFNAGEGYSITDATAAVDSLSVDWNENAAKSATQYLKMSGFSCDGLVEQLSSSAGESYTAGQVRYGAKQAGAC